MLSIIIPTYNQRNRLEETLHALSQQKGLKDTMVYVVNDGSTDGTRAFLEQLNYDWLSIIHQPNLGRSAARNTGMKQVRSKYVLFLDDDMIVTQNFIESHLRAQKHKEGVYIGEIINIPNEHVDKFLERRRQKVSEKMLTDLEQVDLLVNLGRYFYQWNMNMQQREISWVCMVAANVSFPIEMFRQVEGFDEKFKGWGVEDHELAFRFYMSGSTFYYLKEAAAFHLDHRKEINRHQLLENVLYFYKKAFLHTEVKAYVDYVTGRLSMEQLYSKVMRRQPPPTKQEVYFRPNVHLKNKESKEISHAAHH